MKRTKIIAMLAAALALCLCLSACGDTIINVGTVYSREEWADSYFSAARFKYDSDKWTYESVYQANYDSISANPDCYSEIFCDVKSKWKTSQYKLLSIGFVVKTETDCNIDFTIMNRKFYAETTETSFKAGEAQRVVVLVDRPFSEIMTGGSDLNPNSGFNITSFKLVKLDNWQDGDHWAAEINGQKYDWVLKDPEVKYTVSDIQLVIEPIKK